MRRHRRRRLQRSHHGAPTTLADAHPGAQVRIVDLDDLSAAARAQLLALGICPGRCVEVLRQRPVTLVRAEHSELALEDELARGVRVEPEQAAESLG